jgi:hypothetical protein
MSPSLISLLAIFFVAELLFHRLLGRGSDQPGELLGRFTYELVSTFSILLFALALWRVSRAPRYRVVTRLALCLVGGVALLLATLGLWVPLPSNLAFHLRLSLTFFALLTVLSTLGTDARPRIKLGGALLFLPIALRFLAITWRQLAAFGPLDPTTSELQTLSETTLVATALLAPLLFRPDGRRAAGIALLPALLTFGAALGLMFGDRDVASSLCRMLFGLELPLQPIFGALYALALGAVIYAISALLLAGGRDRLRGQGLLLLSLCGLRLDLPYQVMVASLGFLCLLDACLRPHQQALSRPQFETLIKAAAALLGMAQVTITGKEGFEVARLQSHKTSDSPVEVVFERRSHAPKIMEVLVGEAPPRDPPFSLTSVDDLTGGASAYGPRIETGDPLFDARFRLHDRRGVGSALLDEPTRVELRSYIKGWLGVWPQRGLRYRTADWPKEDEVGPLIELLRTLARRSG